MRIIISLIALVLLSGCSIQTVRTAPRIDGGQSTVVNVFVIRNTAALRGFSDSDSPWAVTIDDNARCQMRPGEYTLQHAEEGEGHWVGIQRLAVWWHKEKDFFIAEPDGNYYFLSGVRDNDMFIERIDMETARPYLNSYSPVCMEPKPVQARKEMPVPAPVPKFVPPPPPEPPVTKVEPEQPEITQLSPPEITEIYFDLNSAVIKSEMHPQLNSIVRYLNKVPSASVTIGGHACDIGTDKYNINLSKKRADAVRSYFMDRDIEEERMNIQIFGEADPKYDNSTEETRKLNRRVDFLFKTD